MNVNQKGKRFEREIAKYLNKCFGTNVRRTPNSGGLSIKGDIIDTSGVLKEFHFELKHHEKLNIWKCLDQSISDCPLGKTPLLVFKRNQSEPFVTLRFRDFVNILERMEESDE